MYFQSIIIAAVTVLAPLVAGDDFDPSQSWNSANGQRGFKICPEPGMQDGSRVKSDLCTSYITSEGYVKCNAVPTFKNVSTLEC